MLVNELAVKATEPLYLVLDDAHHINQADELIRILDRFIGRVPALVHPILSTRYQLDLPSLVNWSVRGQIQEVGQEELAFTLDEIARLFHDNYNLALTEEQVDTLAKSLEGWAIGLQLVWQRLQSDRSATLGQALGELSGSMGDLFEYLAQEVLSQQPTDVRNFLQLTSALRQMTAVACDCLRSATDSKQILDYLLCNELFVVDLGNGHVRYHHLFRDLLRQQMSPSVSQSAHLRAAECYRQLDDLEEALYHLLMAEAYDDAAKILDQLGQSMIRAGRLDTLAN